MEQIINLEDSCKKSVEHFKQELGKLRGGKASGALLESITVDYYGAQTPIKQLGMINTPEPRMVTIQVFDASAVASVEKAIQLADLGLNPSRDGSLIRINIPALTEQRRKDLIKALKSMTEDARITIRNHRRDAIDTMKKLEKAKELSEDECRKGQEQAQKITDKYIAAIDELLKVKEAEMMEV
jgi:ribosome recycling factor